MDTDQSEWLNLFHELWRRTITPILSVPFVLYVFIGIIGFGGVGIWNELIKFALPSPPSTAAALVIAIVAFFPAVIGSSSVQLILTAAAKSDKIMISFALFVLVFSSACAIVLPLFTLTHPHKVLAISAFCDAGAVWMWWITNSDEPTYKTHPLRTPTIRLVARS